MLLACVCIFLLRFAALKYYSKISKNITHKVMQLTREKNKSNKLPWERKFS